MSFGATVVAMYTETPAITASATAAARYRRRFTLCSLPWNETSYRARVLPRCRCTGGSRGLFRRGRRQGRIEFVVRAARPDVVRFDGFEHGRGRQDDVRAERRRRDHHQGRRRRAVVL